MLTDTFIDCYRIKTKPFNVRNIEYDEPYCMTFCDNCDDVRYYDEKKFKDNDDMTIPRCLNCGYFEYGKYVKKGRLTQKILREPKYDKRHCCHVCHEQVFGDMKEHQEEMHNMKFGRGVTSRDRSGNPVYYKPRQESIYLIPNLEIVSEENYNIKSMLNDYEIF